MKNTTRLKVFFKKMFKMVTPLDNIEIMEHLMEQNNTALNSFNDQLYNSKAQIRYHQRELEVNSDRKDSLIKIAEKFKSNNNEDGKRETFNKLKIVDSQIALHKEQIELHEARTVSLNSIVENLRNKQTEIQCKLTSYKAKVEFANSVNQYSNINVKGLDINIDDITKEIDIDYLSSEFKLNDIMKNDIVTNATSDLEYEEFYKNL